VNSVRIHETFGKAEINDIDQVFSGFLITYKEIIRLNVSVNYAILMHDVNSLYHLQPEVYTCAQIKLPPALTKEVLQTLA
jgi:hypothetical protein